MKGQISALNERLDVIEGGGDLTKRLSLRSMDEFGQLADSVNRLMDRFRSLIYRIGAAAAETREAAQSIDSVMKGSETATMNVIESVVSLSSSIDKQATESRILKDSLESLRAAARAVAGAVDSQRRFTDETASAMEEMSANIRSVESMTHRSGAVTSDLAAKGNSGNSSVHEAAKAIKDIEKSAADVLKVLGSLSRIAGDTNLLAMNAAIEAAHAGKSGAGFAVVAGEVRSLAASAANETKKIKDLVLEMDGRVHKGVASSEATSQAFLSLSGGIAEAASISAEIASAMKEQSAGTSSVESSINQVQENSRIVRERMEIQERETTLMASGLEETLSRFSSIASSARPRPMPCRGCNRLSRPSAARSTATSTQAAPWKRSCSDTRCSVGCYSFAISFLRIPYRAMESSLERSMHREILEGISRALSSSFSPPGVKLTVRFLSSSGSRSLEINPFS